MRQTIMVTAAIWRRWHRQNNHSRNKTVCGLEIPTMAIRINQAATKRELTPQCPWCNRHRSTK